MPKIDFSMIVFNGNFVLKENLQTIYPYAHKIFISEGPVSYYRNLGYTQSTDGTLEIINNFPDPDKKITLMKGQWQEKDDMVKAQEKYYEGDYVWAIDADEMYKENDIEKITTYLEFHPECYAMSFRLYSLYGGFKRYITGYEENYEVRRLFKIIPGQSYWTTHRPPTMMWPPTNKSCRDMGLVNHLTTDSWGIRIYHYSYCFPKQVKFKMEYYKNRGGRDVIDDYWENLYVPWMRAETEQEKENVEKNYIGVQENIPQIRGEAYTKELQASHPDSIKTSLNNFEKRIAEERKELDI